MFYYLLVVDRETNKEKKLVKDNDYGYLLDKASKLVDSKQYKRVEIRDGLYNVFYRRVCG